MNPQDRQTLESWKEIAAYIQRDAKTARRWEKEEGLPIHRHNHNSRSSVYAYPDEIDAWRASRKSAPEPAAMAAPSFWRIPTFALAMLLCLMMVGNGVRPQAASAEQGKGAARPVLVPKGELEYFTLSPDGKWLGGTDWENGDLVLTRVTSGETRRFVPGHYNKDPDSWGQSPMLSPDQKQIAYWWYDYADPQAHGQVRLIANRPGAQPRVLVQATDGQDGAFPIGWSPDGKRFLVTLGKLEEGRRTKEIAWATVSDGSLQVIKKLDPWNSGKGVSFGLSPDGRYLAYSGRTGPGDPDTGIYLLSADGVSQTLIVRGSTNVSPVWSPDGSRILFSSNRSGAFGLWAVAVRDGKAAGLPSLIKPEINIAGPIGVTRGGRYFYNYRAGLREIFVAEMDPASGKVKPDVLESFVGEAPAWSHDGKWLAFKRLDPGSASERSLVVRSIERGAEWSLVHKLGDSRPLWYRNGTIQYNGSTARISVSSGQPQVVTIPVPVPGGVLSPDEKLMYRRPNGTNDGLDAVDAATGAPAKKLFVIPGGVIFAAVSPDGKTLSVVSANGGNILHLGRINTDGSGYRELAPNVSLGEPVWSRDGRWIYFGEPEKNLATERIMRIPAEGGQEEFTGVSIKDLRGFDLSPDGAKIAYSGGSTAEEVWSIENLPALLK